MTNEKLSTLTVEDFNAMSDTEQHEVVNFFLSDECTVELAETDRELFDAIMYVELEDEIAEFAKEHPDHKTPTPVVCSDFE